MTKNRLGSVCGALPWKLDMRSSTFAVICNAQNLSTGIVLECTGTPTQKTVMNYIIQCANLMPEVVALLKSADEKLIDLCNTCCNAMDAAGLGRFVDCKNCNVESLDTSIKALLVKLEGGADDATNP